MPKPRPSTIKSGTTDAAAPDVASGSSPVSLASLIRNFGALRMKREEMSLSNFQELNKKSIEELKKYQKKLDKEIEALADLRARRYFR